MQSRETKTSKAKLSSFRANADSKFQKEDSGDPGAGTALEEHTRSVQTERAHSTEHAGKPHVPGSSQPAALSGLRWFPDSASSAHVFLPRGNSFLLVSFA